MSKKYGFFGVLMAAALLVGCGGDSDDYSKYVTLGDYKNLSTDLVVEKVTDEELDEYEKEQLDEYVTYEAVSGPVKEGQLVQISLLIKDGDEIVYDFSDEDGYEMIVGEEEYGTDVDDRLIGTNIGDSLDFSVSYEEDFADALLCGKDVDCHIEVLSVSDVSYPKLTDAFVKENFGEQSVEAWRETLTQELLSSHQADAELDLREKLVQEAIDASAISGYPKSLYEQMREETQAGYQSYADMFGCTIDEIYEMFQVDEKMREQEYLDATYRTMVLSMICDRENLSLSDEQLQEKMEAYAQENEYESVDEMLSEYDEASLKSYFQEEVVLDFLEENAKVTTVEE